MMRGSSARDLHTEKKHGEEERSRGGERGGKWRGGRGEKMGIFDCLFAADSGCHASTLPASSGASLVRWLCILLCMVVDGLWTVVDGLCTVCACCHGGRASRASRLKLPETNLGPWLNKVRTG